eukprot:GHVT01065255.1.p1 GENE.GHVT01065255.1~~GHVT01065255.1.p1  ORF type:complete len:599 (+),score=160.05 GHVT01065255.1:195-1991(+)
MAIFKQHGKELGAKSPKEVGETLKDNLKTNLFESVAVAPQGFVTVTMDASWLQQQLQEILGHKELQVEKPQSLRVLVDFSSPNIAKEMHVGHLRSSIIGESICRILSYCGHDVQRINHVGDWGTQFGMLIEHMMEEYPTFQDDAVDIGDLQTFYRAAKDRFDKDEAFKKRAQMMVVKLQGGDPFALKAWKLICAVSRAEFEKVYTRLGITLEERGESFYNELIPDTVQELTEKGLVVESDGAKCVFCGTNKVPLMVVKSDGGYGYDSTDVAAIKHRLVASQKQWLIYVTDLGQEDHFLKIFECAKQAGWHVPPVTRVDHMGFGVVQGEDGKKFKTRSGELVKLVDLLDEAAERAEKEIELRSDGKRDLCEEPTPSDSSSSSSSTSSSSTSSSSTSSSSTSSSSTSSSSTSSSSTSSSSTSSSSVSASSPAAALSEEEWAARRAAAHSIGYSAVKYFDLKQNRQTDYKFNYDRMLDPKGNTAVYLLYAYARICAIFRKSEIAPAFLSHDSLAIVAKEERLLALQILKFPEVIENILQDLHIHRLAEYMYDLSTRFSDFYQNCRVVGVEEQSSRLLLCEMTRKLLKVCFQLLGIEALDRI